MEDSGRYEVAQICFNGHVITSMLESNPEMDQKFCGKCGAGTITECQSCKEKIRGYHIVSGILSLSPYVLPKFCYACGKSYPWTESKLRAAQELTDKLGELTSKEREDLKKSLDEIVKDAPNAQVAAMRFKKLVAKAGRGAAEAFKEILISIVSEAVKKSIWQ